MSSKGPLSLRGGGDGFSAAHSQHRRPHYLLFFIVKCLAQVRGFQDVGYVQKGEILSEGKCWPFPEGPSPFLIHHPLWGCAWSE